MRWNATTVVADVKRAKELVGAAFAAQNEGSAAAIPAEAAAAAVAAVLESGAVGLGPFHVSVSGYLAESEAVAASQRAENSMSITIREGSHYLVSGPAPTPEEEEV